MGIEIIIAIAGGLLIGGATGYFIMRSRLNKALSKQEEELEKKSELQEQEARLKARGIIDEAKNKAEQIVSRAENKQENIKQEKIQEAKERHAKLKAELEEIKSQQKIALKERESEVKNLEKEVEKRQKELDERREEFETRESEIKTMQSSLDKQIDAVEKKKQKVEERHQEIIDELEHISNLSEEEARKELLKAVEDKAETEAMAIVKQSVEDAKANANKKAKKILIQTIQRMCAEYTIENTVSVFNLESDSIKGQIIGREGRNIRALEASTGAEIVVDDTPEAVVISSFDPIRREICRLSLKRLIADGRIHPARIEEVVDKVKGQLDEQIKEIGERTIIDLDIHGLDHYLVKMVGRMRFRSSYGQNLLKHSIETANLCAIMAAELGLSKKEAKLAKRAGLLHDIGKVGEEETELSHALLGMKLCEKYGEHEWVCNAVGAHHDEIDMDNILSPIIQACDAMSGARPGARREIMESYLERIGELEDLALSYDGVRKAYAMQAGRELRVIVESDKVNDNYADDLSFMISQKIQDDMQYPGQIKVTVIRERRAISYAR